MATNSTLRLILRQLRVHQWIKNILIFVPTVFAHEIFNPAALQKGLIAFAAFSMAASFVYLLNDLADLDADRRHLTKRHRPFASGQLPIGWAYLLMPLLLGISLGHAFVLNRSFANTIGIYLLLNIAYSFKIKSVVILDTVFLAGLYTLRIVAGGTATGIQVSQWLFAFSVFLFFGLAMLKRFTEISRADTSEGELKIAGRGYLSKDRPTVFALGIASSLMSVLVLVLYLNSTNVSALYRSPEHLWIMAPILIYWISRVWLLAQRDQIHDDPIIFAIKDPASWLTFLLSALVISSAI